MANIAENINKLMEGEGINASELSRITGIDRSVLHKILSGSTKNPTIESIKSIIKYFSYEEVVYGLPPQKSENDIPLISWAEISLFPNKLTQDKHEYIPIGIKTSKNAFALLIKYTLDSRFPEGTLLIIEPEKEPKHLSYVIVKEFENKSVSFKRFIIEGGHAYLKSIESSIPSIKYDSKSFEIIGVVIRTIFDFDE